MQDSGGGLESDREGRETERETCWQGKFDITTAGITGELAVEA